MKNIRNAIFAILAIGFYSCLNSGYKMEQEYYGRMKRICLDSTIFNELPDKFSKEFIPLSIINPEVLNHGLNYCGLFIQVKQDEISLKKIINKYELDNKILDFSDSCLWTISRKNQDCDSIRLINNHLCAVPVPNLFEQNNVINNFILKNEAQVIILDYGFKRMLPDKYNSNIIASEEKEHGYSKGIITDINRQKLFYYLIIW